MRSEISSRPDNSLSQAAITQSLKKFPAIKHLAVSRMQKFIEWEIVKSDDNDAN